MSGSSHADTYLFIHALRVSFFRVGLSLTGSITYEMTVEGSRNSGSCVAVYDEWPSARLTFSAYYQLRRLWVRTKGVIDNVLEHRIPQYITVHCCWVWKHSRTTFRYLKKELTQIRINTAFRRVQALCKCYYGTCPGHSHMEMKVHLHF